jgi:hypothetical protein
VIKESVTQGVTMDVQTYAFKLFYFKTVYKLYNDLLRTMTIKQTIRKAQIEVFLPAQKVNTISLETFSANSSTKPLNKI